MKEKIREQINDVSEGMTNTNGHESTDEQPERDRGDLEENRQQR